MLVIIKFLLKRFNCDIINYLYWQSVPNIYDSIKQKVLHFVLSKTLILKPLLRVVFVRTVLTWPFIIILSKLRKMLNTSILGLRMVYVWINWIRLARLIVFSKACFTIYGSFKFFLCILSSLSIYFNRRPMVTKTECNILDEGVQLH